MRRLPLIVSLLMLGATYGVAGSWTGRLVDAVCKVSNPGEDSFTALCPATPTTHLFAIQLPNSHVLVLDAGGNAKADEAVRLARKPELHVTVTGALDGPMVRVEKLAVQK